VSWQKPDTDEPIKFPPCVGDLMEMF